jgi:asparagine synthetase B (glutamine-hydrolysing)
MIELVGPLDGNFAWDGRQLYDEVAFHVGGPPLSTLRGAAASVHAGPAEAWRILRDPLGINKLFWAPCSDGRVALAARPRRLIDAGIPLEQVQAFPRGCVLDLTPSESRTEQLSILPEEWFSADRGPAPTIEATAEQIRSLLDGYLAALASAYPHARVFICLSGGLDSSGIATLARRHFPDLVGVSFDLKRRSSGPSEDRLAARRLAEDLRLPLLEATVTEDQLLEPIDTVLVEGVDWRDFNVHAALVNAALAAAIDEAVPTHDRRSPVIVLTGDLANEFLADYHEERYKDTTYYALPRLPTAALRTALVRGLDTCHREVGVFGAWRVAVVQPYAAAADAYLRLPADFLRRTDAKQHLCRMVFGQLLPDWVYARPKVRAQVGSAETGGGVLAACVDRGIDAAWLRRRFAKLHATDDQAALARFMRAGRYRTAIPLGGD